MSRSQGRLATCPMRRCRSQTAPATAAVLAPARRVTGDDLVRTGRAALLRAGGAKRGANPPGPATTTLEDDGRRCPSIKAFVDEGGRSWTHLRCMTRKGSGVRVPHGPPANVLVSAPFGALTRVRERLVPRPSH